LKRLALILFLLMITLPAQANGLTVGTSVTARSLLIFMAEAEGFFKENGLNVTVKTYETGLNAINDILAGKLDLAVASEFVILQHNLSTSTEPLKIISSISRSTDIKVVARKDASILHLTDLKGKRIGLQKGTDSEFLLYVTCIFNNISYKDLNIIDYTPSELPEAIFKNKVDAVVCWDPHAKNAEKLLGNDAISWQAGEKVYSNWVLCSTDNVIKAKSPLLEKFLKSLLQSERLVYKNPESAGIILKKQGLDADSYQSNMEIHRVMLNRLLLLDMEDRVRWILSLRQNGPTEMPVLWNYIDFDLLKRVDPSRVSIIH
jgi:NitT/TauT family transport system substrate-binding protein